MSENSEVNLGNFEVFPSEVLGAIEDNLHSTLMKYVQSGAVPRCLLAFIQENDAFEFRWQLKTDRDWDILMGRVDQGMLGKALTSGFRETWRLGDEGKPFRKGDPRTIYEIAQRIELRGRPTAVFLIDYFEGETELDPDDPDNDPPNTPTNALIRSWKEEISEVLRSSDEAAQKLINSIEAEVKDVVDQIGCLRGYAAIKNWDGTIRYFTYGEGKEKFLQYNQLEGICGDVMLKGRFQNVGNVWEHPSYRSSDNEIKSEAVAPIIVNDECVGVLNMEADTWNYFNPQFAQIIKNRAGQLRELARRFREPIGLEVGDHSRLLNDLIEQFSVADEGIGSLSDARSIWEWATGLCQRKILSLRNQVEHDPDSVRFFAAAERKKARRSAELKVAEDRSNFAMKEVDGKWLGEFKLVVDGYKEADVLVKFKGHPRRTSLEIIAQFCRLTANEIRRRRVEARGAEFERFVTDARRASEGSDTDREAFLANVPMVVSRMMHCDHATYFKAFHQPDSDVPILRVWQSTSDHITYRSEKERFYRASPDDGLTGYAASQREVFIVKNLRAIKELRSSTPRLNWKQKIAEQESTEFRTFFAVPLYSGNTLVGVLRGHRTADFSNISFSEAERERLQSVQFLLEGVISKVESQSALCKK